MVRGHVWMGRGRIPLFEMSEAELGCFDVGKNVRRCRQHVQLLVYDSELLHQMLKNE